VIKNWLLAESGLPERAMLMTPRAWLMGLSHPLAENSPLIC
jgi:hypothetical protein